MQGGGRYHPTTGAVQSTAKPGVVGHEFAHANFYENMPPAMSLAAYPMAHQFAQWVDPQYREAVERYPKWQGKQPIEGYATAYQHLGDLPGAMPWYMEPFYGNLMYEVPDLPGATLEKTWPVWLGYWLKDKVEHLSEKKQAEWQSWLGSLSKAPQVSGKYTAAQEPPKGIPAWPEKPRPAQGAGGAGGPNVELI